MRGFHVLTVGWIPELIRGVLDPVEAAGGVKFSHLLHPKYCANENPELAARTTFHFFRERLETPMPPADPSLLATLEGPGIPTVHNMILGDRVLSKLPYADSLAYATFMARRLAELIDSLKPTVVLTAFDSLQGALTLAVARKLGRPCFAMHFSVLPPGYATFCDRMCPAARVQMRSMPESMLREIAQRALSDFRERRVRAAAYIPPAPRSLLRQVVALPGRASVVARVLRRRGRKEFLRYTEDATDLDLFAAVGHLWRARLARRAIELAPARAQPPREKYVLFGLHMQPESSIDVWAPFYANQMAVIETLARSLPPTHRLLVKIHKSDVAKYSRRELKRIWSLPGVELVRPMADTRTFIEGADLIVAIQGTMGLEGAMLGKPVIMLGESAVSLFPSAAQAGAITELPVLIRRQLALARPSDEEILNGFIVYLRPFLPATLNDWTVRPSATEIGNYVALFAALAEYIQEGGNSDARRYAS